MSTSFFRAVLKALGGAAALLWVMTSLWAQEAAPVPTHALAQQMAKLGAFSCAAKTNQVANFLSPAGSDTALLHVPTGNADRSLISASLFMPMGPKQVAVANITVAPNQANGCGATYQTFFYHAKACKQAMAEIYPNLKTQPVGDSGVDLGGINRNAQVFSVPAGEGCILIKQEVVE
jgi:hypothetical protein